MAYAPGGRKAEVGGMATGGGGLPVSTVPEAYASIVGGPMSYAMASLWLFLAWAGWVIAGYNNGQSDDMLLRNQYMHANYPDLDAGSLLRFDWFVVFLLFIVLCMVTAALVTRALVQARMSVVAFLAIVTVLIMLSADRMHNLTNMYIGQGLYSGARCAFAGFVIAAISCLGLVYHLGINPHPI